MLNKAFVFFTIFTVAVSAAFWADARQDSVMPSFGVSGFEQELSLSIEQDGDLVQKIISPSLDEKAELSLPDQRIHYIHLHNKDKSGPFRLFLGFDEHKNIVTLQGQGEGPFQKITINNGDFARDIYADWNGGFSHALDDNVQNAPLRIAFHAHIQNDAMTHAPERAKEVFFLRGGGFGGEKADMGVNQISVISMSGFCGTPQSSYCIKEDWEDYTDELVANVSRPFQHMGEQFHTNAMQAALYFGMAMDAKNQMEVQRTYQVLKARAAKDYYPSEAICEIGSYMRSVAKTESAAKLNHLGLNRIMMDRFVNKRGASSQDGFSGDLQTRFNGFTNTYCDPNDNNENLKGVCANPTDDSQRTNKDIDFTRTLDYPYTLDGSFTKTSASDDTADLVALARNLYWNAPTPDYKDADISEGSQAYMRQRRLYALNGIAHNSYAAQAAAKMAAPDPEVGVEPGWAYMKTFLRDFGLSDDDIASMVGENPSYFAQMDILTKKLYQNPNFYTNLYDKPANVARMNASLEAIKLMQMRDHYKARLRQEMLASAMIESDVTRNLIDLNVTLQNTQ